MNNHLLTFFVGLVALTRADVSHLKQSDLASNTLSNDLGASAGNSRYWWMNTKTSPFTKSHNTEQNFNTLNSVHQTQNNPHQTQQHNYQNNPFLNGAAKGHQQHNIHAHMATLSGSPREVNSLMQDTTHSTHIAQQYRAAPKVPCYGASQVCAPRDACQNGFISESNLGLVLSQSNVSRL